MDNIRRFVAPREEARLIYLGVAHTSPDTTGRHLVIDIGGGSTECIIGERFDPLALHSLYMGCVGYTAQYFANGKLNRANFERARRERFILSEERTFCENVEPA